MSEFFCNPPKTMVFISQFPIFLCDPAASARDKKSPFFSQCHMKILIRNPKCTIRNGKCLPQFKFCLLTIIPLLDGPQITDNP